VDSRQEVALQLGGWMRANNSHYSVRNGNVEVPVYFLKAEQGYTVRKRVKYKYILYIDTCQYEIKEQKEVPVWYTGI
jgi:hypothetical protein